MIICKYCGLQTPLKDEFGHREYLDITVDEFYSFYKMACRLGFKFDVIPNSNECEELYPNRVWGAFTSDDDIIYCYLQYGEIGLAEDLL